jgi:HD-GYP domain-containing protein (c-di-GMP phosphodiesterase class II)
LFHDIGKLYISRRILNKNERLSESEFSEMKSHTVLGAEIMLGYVDSLGFLPVVVCCEHHLKYDLSGYPRIPILKKPHIASLIVSMCDVYDALSQRRSYKADYSPDMIYNTMNREKGTTFDPILLDKFFSVIGVWPIGSIIALDNSEVAVVREQNKEDIFLPKVEVVYPDSKRRFIDLRKEKEHFKIERFLNPWKEGKDYLHLI